MQKTNVIFTAVIVVFLGFYAYTVFLSDTALIDRTKITKDGKGGYITETVLLNGSTITETYVVDDKGNPYSHTLASTDSAPGSKPRIIKQGTFVPKHQ